MLAAALLLLSGTAFVVTATPAQALDNGVGRTPPMGWNSWNTFFCNINESLIRGMADSIVSTGMRDAGYQYVVVDDCWMNPNRDSGGNLQADPARFPSGMKALGDYIHSRGLKFGIYQAPLDKTCAQYFGNYPGATGSQGHETQDARQFAAWGVDYLKYDWCSPSGTIAEQVATFAKMRDALAATGRPILYSINPNSIHAKTGPQRDWGDVANIWRTTEDIQLVWKTDQVNGYPMGVQNIIDVTVPLAGYAKPGGFNDPDMMEVGRGTLTDTEQRSHFAMWAVMAAPLIAGNDIRSMSAATQTILKNPRLIAVNQDPLGRQGVQVAGDTNQRVLAKRLSNGDVAVALFNQSGSTRTIATTAAAIGKSGASSYTLVDAWTGATTTTAGTISAAVPAHGTAVYRVSGGTTGEPSTPAVFSLVSSSSGRCLDVPNSNTTNGTQPVVWDCSNAANQKWTASGQTLQALGKCLDAPINGTAGTKVQLWDCNGGSNQQWTQTGGTIRNNQTGLCLDVNNNQTANGTLTLLWTCTGAANQQWSRRS
ncbi:alpha-galactosidase [Paractinoplanes abujensis]|nr:alpha-galactosidase [Actinoplanes abujensis]